MNCQEAIERLPWWLNGSLESPERKEVGEHLEGCAACREALGETRLAWEIYDQHIPAEALVAYAGGEPLVGDSALYERHLANCPQCAAELEMARASFLLGEHDEVAVMPLRVPASVRRARPERGWQAAALAAGLTGLIAIGGWVTSVRQVRQLERTAGTTAAASAAPRSAAGTSTLFFNLDTATRSEATGPLQVPASAGHATLVLHPGPADTYREHTFRIDDERGKIVAPEARLLRNPEDFYSVDLDLGLLPRGGYTIQTFGTDGGAHIAVDRFPFTVTGK
jgi:anti-sigma factor RsiW